MPGKILETIKKNEKIVSVLLILSYFGLLLEYGAFDRYRGAYLYFPDKLSGLAISHAMILFVPATIFSLIVYRLSKSYRNFIIIFLFVNLAWLILANFLISGCAFFLPCMI